MRESIEKRTGRPRPSLVGQHAGSAGETALSLHPPERKSRTPRPLCSESHPDRAVSGPPSIIAPEMDVSVWTGALSAAVSRGSAPLVVGACRRGNTRVTAVIGGLVLALASLFTSFALHTHQVLLRYVERGDRITRSVVLFLSSCFLVSLRIDGHVSSIKERVRRRGLASSRDPRSNARGAACRRSIRSSSAARRSLRCGASLSFGKFALASNTSGK